MEYQKIKRIVTIGPDKGETKCYYTFRNRKHIDNEALMEKIRRRSGVSKADIIRIFYLLGDVLREELKESNIVQVDRIGSFRMAASSGEVDENASFHPNKVEGVRIIFTPDPSLKLNPADTKDI